VAGKLIQVHKLLLDGVRCKCRTFATDDYASLNDPRMPLTTITMRLARLFKAYRVSVRQLTSLPALFQTVSTSVPDDIEPVPGFINVERGEGTTQHDSSSLPLLEQWTYRTDKLWDWQNQRGI
jgi:hypothetical protein